MIIEGTLYYIRPEKIKIGDKKFRSIRHEILETLEENIKKRVKKKKYKRFESFIFKRKSYET